MYFALTKETCQYWTCFKISLRSSRRLGSGIFLESRRPFKISPDWIFCKERESKETQPMDTGPASVPRPASSNEKLTNSGIWNSGKNGRLMAVRSKEIMR